MKILITGATGFIGSHLTEELVRRGHAVRCLIRPTSNLVWIQHLPIERAHGDFDDDVSLQKAVADVDIVFHAAGVTKARTKDEYFTGNYTPTKNLLLAALKSDPTLKRFVHISSQAAIGPSIDGKPVNEQTPFHPVTTYGISKMEAEKECLRLMDRLPITIVRPPAVYGPRDKDIFEFFNAMNRGLQPMIGFTTKTVSLIHVFDLVAGIVLAAEQPKAVGETYFVSSERHYTWKEVGQLTARIMGKRVLRVKVPEIGVYMVAGFSELFSMVSRRPVLLNWEKARDIVQSAWTCSVEKAKRELGFRESLTLERGIQNTVQWYRAQGWLK